MSHYLLELGYQVDLAVDGITATQHIHSKTHDLIVTGLRLYGVSDREIIQNVLDTIVNAGTQLIVWSAYVNKNNEKKYLDWSADGVLIKAYSYQELKNTIQ